MPAEDHHQPFEAERALAPGRESAKLAMMLDWLDLLRRSLREDR
jgi:hypothetical protein